MLQMYLLMVILSFNQYTFCDIKNKELVDYRTLHSNFYKQSHMNISCDQLFISFTAANLIVFTRQSSRRHQHVNPICGCNAINNMGRILFL